MIKETEALLKTYYGIDEFLISETKNINEELNETFNVIDGLGNLINTSIKGNARIKG